MSPVPMVISQSFAPACMDEFLCDLRMLGVDIVACQLDSQTNPCSIDVAASSSVRAMHYTVGNRIHHLLGSEEGSRMFGFLVGKQAPSQVKGRDFSPGDILQVDREVGLDAVIQPGFSAVTVSVGEKRLEEVARLIGVSDFSSAIAGVGAEKHVPGEMGARISQQTRHMVTQAKHSPGEPWVEEFFEFELPAMLLRGWCGPDMIGEDRSARSARSRARQRAVEYIRNAGNQVLTVEQLCRASACSYSTLERSFREQYGITPKRYLVNARLSGVRQALLSGEHFTVTAAALEWGFCHLGKFAADYQNQFGELPSETARYRSHSPGVV